MRVLERSDLRQIREVRLVGEGGNEIVLATEAWTRAEDMGLDLILVSDEDTKPPVVRIQDYKKLLFEKKKAQSQKPKKKSELKEIQLKANISDHDLQTKLNSIERFLERGDKVKIIVRLKGRERDNPQRAHDLLQKVISMVKIGYKETKLAGPIAMAILEPGASKT